MKNFFLFFLQKYFFPEIATVSSRSLDTELSVLKALVLASSTSSNIVGFGQAYFFFSNGRKHLCLWIMVVRICYVHVLCLMIVGFWPANHIYVAFQNVPSPSLVFLLRVCCFPALFLKENMVKTCKKWKNVDFSTNRKHTDERLMSQGFWLAKKRKIEPIIVHFSNTHLLVSDAYKI